MLSSPQSLLLHSVWNMKTPSGMKDRLQTAFEKNFLMKTNGLDKSIAPERGRGRGERERAPRF